MPSWSAPERRSERSPERPPDPRPEQIHPPRRPLPGRQSLTPNVGSAVRHSLSVPSEIQENRFKFARIGSKSRSLDSSILNFRRAAGRGGSRWRRSAPAGDVTAAPEDALAESVGRVTGRKCRRAASNLGESDPNRGVTTAVSCISDARRDMVELATRGGTWVELATRGGTWWSWRSEVLEREVLEREVPGRAG